MSLPGKSAKRRACDSCYKKKIHCDGDVPRCNHCKHHYIACTFNRPSKRKYTTKNKDGPEKLDVSLRIEQLERKLAQITTPDLLATGLSPTEDVSSILPDTLSVSSSELFSQLPAISSRKLHFAGCHLGEISSYNGIPLFSSNGRSWIQTRTGGVIAFPNITAPLWQNQQHNHEASRPSVSDYPLPSRSVTLEYFMIYCSSAWFSVFPFVDAELFKHTIDVAYDETMPGSANAKACILSFLSIVVLIEGKLESRTVDDEACAAKAMQSFPFIFFEPNIAGLETTLMQCIYHLFSGRLQTAAMIHSLACRLMFMLGVHFQATDFNEADSPSPAKKHLRNLFWLCYTFDKEISLRTGQPPAIDDEHCDLTLPEIYRDSKLAIEEGGTPHFPGDLRLSILKDKVSKHLYSAKALRKSDADLLRDIRELDDELEEWRMLIDPRMRPTLTYPSEQPHLGSELTIAQKMHIMITHFEYHYLMATIHRASGRCRSWTHSDGGEMEGISSSLALSVEASRSTLLYLRATVQYLFGQSFWIIVFYPMSAVVTIFFNILLNPLCPRSQQDIELLKSTPELIKAIYTRRLTPREALHMTMVEDFISELARLGDCAIQKAFRDRDS